MNHYKAIRSLFFLATIGFLSGCAAKDDYTGVEYAPQMYHSTPYEPLSQIKDESAGEWLDSNPEDEHGEFYNSNPYNTSKMTMREPVSGTVKRTRPGVVKSVKEVPYRIPKDSLEMAARLAVSPLKDSKEVLKKGKALYERFCKHCHGTKGQGDGLVGKVFLGVTPYTSAAVKDKPEGHIFHVITHGKGRMGSHASQLSVTERWTIVKYVQTLQKQ